MALSNRSLNQVLGRRIKHPPSTNFYEAEETPVSKRLKRFASIESIHSCASSVDSDSVQDTSELDQSTIPNSEVEADGNEDDTEQTDDIPVHSTELESTLPLINTDKEAIDNYEALQKGVHEDDLDPERRLERRQWIKGKSSIYVDAFNLALKTVLEDEVHLFNETELAVFKVWQELPYEAQYL